MVEYLIVNEREKKERKKEKKERKKERKSKGSWNFMILRPLLVEVLTETKSRYCFDSDTLLSTC